MSLQRVVVILALLQAFGMAQLMWGPLSDRDGRRPIEVSQPA
ncbi:MAG: hypothetical protein ACKOWC_09610 [Limnohabitans sp.]